MEKRTLKPSFYVSGSGSTSAKFNLPIAWLRAMGASEDDREFEATFDGEKIILKKVKKGIDNDGLS